MTNSDKLIIKKLDTVITFDRSQIASCNETSDGIVLILKNGLLIQYTDNFMESSTKARIKLAIDKIPNGSITINLHDYRSPITIDNT